MPPRSVISLKNKQYPLQDLTNQLGKLCEDKPDVNFWEEKLLVDIKCIPLSTELLSFRFLRFEPNVILFAGVSSTFFLIEKSVSSTSILSLWPPKVIFITSQQQTKSIHTIFVCRITTAKTPSCINNIKLSYHLNGQTYRYNICLYKCVFASESTSLCSKIIKWLMEETWAFTNALNQYFFFKHARYIASTAPSDATSV